MDFKPLKRSRLGDQLAERIRRAIIGGELREGDTLPSERDLAERFGVNRSSVREALLRLEAWGLVDIKHGAGARILDVFQTASVQLLPFLLAPGGQIDRALLADALAIRAMLLAWTAEQAALRAQPQDVEALRAILARLEAAESVAEVQRRDFDFFACLIEITGNRVLVLLANAFRAVYDQNAQHFDFLFAPEAFDAGAHRATLEAIARGDAAAAAAAMKAYGHAALVLAAGA